ncbi:MAG: permease [Atribacterota bacterium]|nr:permease [Atribacterota bacterium]
MNIIKKFKAVIVIILIYIGLIFWLPDTAAKSFSVAVDYAKEMVFIIPPVFILMGLLEVWIPKDKIQQWLGSSSGLKGILISFLMGTLPTGPLYVAFPMTATLLKKGASISNMVIFLGSWAALKIPQLLVEIKFLGVAFTLLRFVLTFTVIVIIGIIMERTLSNK